MSVAVAATPAESSRRQIRDDLRVVHTQSFAPSCRPLPSPPGGVVTRAATRP